MADVLSYVEYDPKELVGRFRSFAEKAVADGRISPEGTPRGPRPLPHRPRRLHLFRGVVPPDPIRQLPGPPPAVFLAQRALRIHGVGPQIATAFAAAQVRV